MTSELPYEPPNVDRAVVHLTRVLCSDSRAVPADMDGDGAVALLREAVEQARAGGEIGAETAWLFGTVSALRGDVEEARAVAGELEAMEEDPAGLARMLRAALRDPAMGREELYWWAVRTLPNADEAFEFARPLLSSEEPLRAATAGLVCAVALDKQGRNAEALAMVERACELAGGTGDAELCATLEHVRGAIRRTARGGVLADRFVRVSEELADRPAERVREFESLIAEARELGFRDLVGYAHTGAARALLALGEFARAAEHARNGLTALEGMVAEDKLDSVRELYETCDSAADGQGYMRQLTEAVDRMNAGDVEGARGACEALVALIPIDGAPIPALLARHGLAEALRRGGDTEGAAREERALLRLVEEDRLQPHGPTVWRLLALSQDEAVRAEALHRLEAEARRSREGALLLGEALVLLGRASEAKAHLDAVVATGDERQRARALDVLRELGAGIVDDALDRARTATGEDRWEDAEDELRRAAEEAERAELPDRLGIALAHLSTVLHRRGAMEEAFAVGEAARRCASRSGEDGAAVILDLLADDEAEAMQIWKELEGATAMGEVERLEEFVRRLRPGPLRTRAIQRLVAALCEDERVEEARKWLAALAGQAPHRTVEAASRWILHAEVDMELRRALLLAKSGRLEDAIASAKALLARVEEGGAPATAASIHALLSQFLVAADHAEEAEFHAGHAMKLAGHSEAHSAYLREQVEHAANAKDRAKKRAAVAAADEHLSSGRLSEARAAFAALVNGAGDDSPLRTRATLGLAAVSVASGDVAEAIERFDSALSDPDLPEEMRKVVRRNRDALVADPERMRFRTQLNRASTFQGVSAARVAWFRRWVAQARERGWEDEEMNALALLIPALARTSDPREGREACERMRGLAERLGSEPAATFAAHWLERLDADPALRLHRRLREAERLVLERDLGGAEALLRDICAAAEELDDVGLRSSAAQRLAMVLLATGRRDEARSYVEGLRERVAGMRDEVAADAVNTLVELVTGPQTAAHAQLVLARQAEVHRRHEQEFGVSYEENEQAAIREAELRGGHARYTLGTRLMRPPMDLTAASEHLSEAMAVARRLDDRSLLGHALGERGICRAGMGLVYEGARDLEEAISVLEGVNGPSSLPRFRHFLAQLGGGIARPVEPVVPDTAAESEVDAEEDELLALMKGDADEPPVLRALRESFAALAALGTPRGIELAQARVARLDARAEPRRWAQAKRREAQAWLAVYGPARPEAVEHAAACLEEILATESAFKDDEERADVLVHLAACLSEAPVDRLQPALVRAVAAAEQALSLLDPDKSPRLWALAVLELAFAIVGRRQRSTTADHARAIRLLSDAVDRIDPKKDPELWHKLVHNLSVALIEEPGVDHRRSREQAIALLQRALTQFPDSGEIRGSLLMELGLAYGARRVEDSAENIDRAIELIEESLEMRKADPARWARAAANLASLLARRIRGVRRDNLARAEDYLTRAREIVERVGGEEQKLHLLATLGNLLHEQGAHGQPEKLDGAVQMFEEARARALRAQHPHLAIELTFSAATSRCLRGMTRDDPADLEGAAERFGEVTRATSASATPLLWARAQSGRGDALHARARLTTPAPTRVLEEAERCYGAALSVYALDCVPGQRRVVAAHLGEVRMDGGRFGAAVTAFRLAEEAGQEAYRLSMGVESADETILRMERIATRHALALVRMARPLEAVRCIERALAFRRHVTSGAGQDVLTPELRQRDEGLYVELEAARARLIRARTRMPAETEVTPEGAGVSLEELQEASRALSTLIERANAVLNRGSGGLKPVSEPWSTDPARAWVYFVDAVHGTFALLVRRGTCSVIEYAGVDMETLGTWLQGELPGGAARELALGGVAVPATAGWIGALNRRDDGPAARQNCLHETSKLCATLGEVLLAPIVAVLRQEEIRDLTLVPLGAFRTLPLHAARLDGRHLHDELDVVYAPNAGIRAASPRWDDAGVLAIGVGAADPDAPLPTATLEASAVASLFRRSTVLLDEHAGVETVKAAIGTANVAHFACHAYLHVTRPWESHLELAGGEHLTVRDLATSARPDGWLAVLSACNSGAHLIRWRSGGMADAMLDAGFRWVIVTMWPVEDFVTALLMIRFYATLAGSPGASVPTLLRQAQLWLRDTNNREKAHYVMSLGESDGPRLPSRVVAALFHRLVRRPDLDRSEAHPYWWAGYYVLEAT